MIKKVLILSIVGAFLFASCNNDDDSSPTPPETTTFRITITNTINYLGTTVFDTPVGMATPGPLTAAADSYSFDFYAYPGSRLSFVSMLANSNDWFFAPGESGIELFDAGGNPVTGDVTDEISLWDAGTEEEDPATIATEPGGATAGDPDDDTNVRILSNTVSDYFTAELSHDGTRFTMTITRTDTGIVTPGIAVVHAQEAPFFNQGEPDRGHGLEALAEAGIPANLNVWFNEPGTDGAPLRLSSSHTPFSPGVVYAFSGDSDPLFTQGQSATTASGLEALAEDGDIQTVSDYLNGQGLSVATSNAPILPGGSLTFDIEASVGDKLGFATMFVQSNDWFLAFNNDGVALFNENGEPVSGTDSSIQTYLFDAGTEEDEAVGFGANQALRQAAANTGDADDDTTVRRVTTINDTQFNKGNIISVPGVTGYGDLRGGYNLIQINIEPIN